MLGLPFNSDSTCQVGDSRGRRRCGKEEERLSWYWGISVEVLGCSIMLSRWLPRCLIPCTFLCLLVARYYRSNHIDPVVQCCSPSCFAPINIIFIISKLLIQYFS